MSNDDNVIKGNFSPESDAFAPPPTQAEIALGRIKGMMYALLIDVFGSVYANAGLVGTLDMLSGFVESDIANMVERGYFTNEQAIKYNGWVSVLKTLSDTIRDDIMNDESLKEQVRTEDFRP